MELDSDWIGFGFGFGLDLDWIGFGFAVVGLVVGNDFLLQQIVACIVGLVRQYLSILLLLPIRISCCTTSKFVSGFDNQSMQMDNNNPHVTTSE